MLKLDNELVLALKNNDLNLLNQLLDEGHTITEDDNSAIRYASHQCDYETNMYLLSLGADPLVNRYEPLFNAVATNKLELVKHLISLGSDPHYEDDETPYGLVGSAASKGYLEMMKYLISLGCSIHLWDDGAIRYASWRGYYDCANYLIGLEPMNLHSENELVFRDAISQKNYTLLSWLFDNTDKPFSSIQYGMASACYMNSKKLIKFLSLHSKEEPNLKAFETAIIYHSHLALYILQKFNCEWLHSHPEAIAFCINHLKFDIAEKMIELHKDKLFSIENKVDFSISIAEELKKDTKNNKFEHYEKIIDLLNIIHFDWSIVNHDKYCELNKIKQVYDLQKKLYKDDNLKDIFHKNKI